MEDLKHNLRYGLALKIIMRQRDEEKVIKLDHSQETTHQP